jgi:hypothetical protein
VEVAVVKAVVEVQVELVAVEEIQVIQQVQVLVEEQQVIKPQSREKMVINLEEIEAEEAVVVEVFVVEL